MEDMIAAVLSTLIGVVGFFLGQRLQHKNKTLAAQSRWYEEELANMRTEIKRYRAKAAYFAKGAVTAEIADAGSPSALIDAVLGALPPNFRQMVAPFRQSIIKHAEENPELVRQITEVVKEKVTGIKKEGDGNAQQADYL